MAVTVELVADVADVVRGAGDVSKKFEDVSDSLIDMAREAKDSSRKVEAALEDAGDSTRKIDDGLKDSGAAAQAFEDKARKALKNMSAAAGNESGKVAKETKEGFDKGGESVETFKDEAKSNLSEVASSFSGDMDSAVDLIQGTLGGLVADLGPAGLVGGAVAALAIGLAKAAADGEAERINRIGEAAAGLAQEIQAVGGNVDEVDFSARMQEWGTAIQDTREWWELWQDSAKSGARLIEEQAKAAGLGFEDMFKGAAGSGDDAEAALKQIDTLLEDLNGQLTTSTDEWGRSFTTGSPELEARIAALGKLKTRVQENADVNKEAERTAQLMKDADIDTAESAAALEDATRKANDELLKKAGLMDDNAQAAIGADEAELAWGETLKTTKADIEANGKSTDLNTEAGKANRQTLLDMASGALELEAAHIRAGGSTADVTGKTNAARTAFENAAVAAGYTRDEARDLATKYGLIPANVDTKVKAHNVQQTKNEIDGVASPRTVPVTPVLSNTWSFHQELANATAPVNQPVYMQLLKNNGRYLP
ncbi:tape measure protein [Arthrobacter phage Berka]|nr:tape measure protein [Arthrobacter phage Berka]